MSYFISGGSKIFVRQPPDPIDKNQFIVVLRLKQLTIL